MTRYFLIASIFCIICIACSSNENEQSAIKEIIKKDTIPESEALHAKMDSLTNEVESIKFLAAENEFSSYFYNVISPAVFTKTTNVYAKKDTASPLLSQLVFNSGVVVTNLDDEFWYEIDWSGQKGYVLKKDIAEFSFSGPVGSDIKYFIDKQIPAEENDWKNKFTFYAYNFKEKQFVDSISDETVRLDNIRIINTENWKNADLFLLIDETNPYCGGTQRQLFLLVANNKIRILFKTSSFIDDGGEGEWSTWVFLPHNPEKDTIRFGDYESNSVLDKNGNPKLDQQGNKILKVVKDIVIKYHWNGKDLVRLN